jgi:hypothetical protein
MRDAATPLYVRTRIVKLLSESIINFSFTSNIISNSCTRHLIQNHADEVSINTLMYDQEIIITYV